MSCNLLKSRHLRLCVNMTNSRNNKFLNYVFSDNKDRMPSTYLIYFNALIAAMYKKSPFKRYQYTLRRCLKKECYKQCRYMYVKFKWNMTTIYLIFLFVLIFKANLNTFSKAKSKTTKQPSETINSYDEYTCINPFSIEHIRCLSGHIIIYDYFISIALFVALNITNCD